MGDTDGMSFTDDVNGPLGEGWKVFSPDDPDFNVKLEPIRLNPAPPGTWFIGYFVFEDETRHCAVQCSGHEITVQQWFGTSDEAQAFIREQRRGDG